MPRGIPNPKPKKCFCGELLKGHPRCEACGILCGSGHIFQLVHYGGHNLCSGCAKVWKLHPERDWKDFTHPSTSKVEIGRLEVTQAKYLYKLGWSTSRIAKHLNVTRQTVRRWISG